MDRRLEYLDYVQSYKDYVEDSSSRVIAIGEADSLSPLVQRAPGRVASGIVGDEGMVDEV